MRVFLDFEASSLDDRSYPIEVAWVFEDGTSEAHLIRPASTWLDWSAKAEAIHHIDRITLERDGVPIETVAARMAEVLTGHDLFASAPSWDGKWLSVLLRAAGLPRHPRHSLRLRDSEEAQRESAAEILSEVGTKAERGRLIENLMVLVDVRSREQPPEHRALADAEAEWKRWRAVCDAARREAAAISEDEPRIRTVEV